MISGILAGLDSAIKGKNDNANKNVLRNSGFAKGRMDDKPHVVAIVSLVVTAMSALCLYLAPGFPNEKSAGTSRADKNSTVLYRLGMAFILGGGISNTYDRLRKRYVVDYIPVGKYVYNLSDFFIFIGTAISTMAVMSRGFLERES